MTVLTYSYASQSGWDPGYRRRPKAKYASGAAPKEATNTITAAHIHFGPRIWLAGRRWMSMRAATMRLASATPAAMSSLRLRSLRSLHRFLAAMTPSAHMAGIPDGLHVTSVRQPPLLWLPFRQAPGCAGQDQRQACPEGITCDAKRPCQ